MEWVAWVTFGPPSDSPNDHWVNEEISDGPEIKELKTKPSGRVDQRKKEIEYKTISKVAAESNSIKSTQVVIQQGEYLMMLRNDELKAIQYQLKHSKTELARVSCGDFI